MEPNSNKVKSFNLRVHTEGQTDRREKGRLTQTERDGQKDRPTQIERHT